MARTSTLLCALVAQCAGAPLLKGHPTVYGARYVKSLGGSTPEVNYRDPRATRSSQLLAPHVAQLTPFLSSISYSFGRGEGGELLPLAGRA